MNGPFQTARATSARPPLLLHRVPAAQDHAVGPLVVTGLVTLGRNAPGRDPVLAALGAAAMRMVDRVLGDAAGVRADTEPAAAPGLADDDVLLIGIRHRADRREAVEMHLAHLTGAEADQRIVDVAADQLHERAGGARQLPALLRPQLHIVDDGADGNGLQRHGVAWLDVGALARHDLIADLQPLRRQDIALLAVLVADQRDERGPVRIVFQPLDGRRHVELAALEVDQPDAALVPAADSRVDQMPVVVAPAGLALAHGQRLHGTAGPQLATIDG